MPQDAARQLPIPAEGSLQNPAFSPDGARLLLTRFRSGYNQPPADLLVYDLQSGELQTLLADGYDNINLPGSSWIAPAGRIVFSSTRPGHDEIFRLDWQPGAAQPGNAVQITGNPDRMAYEPSLSPDGEWLVFESHPLDVEGEGVITRCRVADCTNYQPLTPPGEDCRQPNWSPAGDWIVFQKLVEEQWELWLVRPDGSSSRQLTGGAGDKTDASFSPDGKMLVYSSDQGELEHANLFILPLDGGAPQRLNFHSGYAGAPSWSPDGKTIVFESLSPASSQASLWLLAYSDFRSLQQIQTIEQPPH